MFLLNRGKSMFYLFCRHNAECDRAVRSRQQLVADCRFCGDESPSSLYYPHSRTTLSAAISKIYYQQQFLCVYCNQQEFSICNTGCKMISCLVYTENQCQFSMIGFLFFSFMSGQQFVCINILCGFRVQTILKLIFTLWLPFPKQ